MLSKSARYYRSHPEARKVKALMDSKINKRPEQVKKRVEANRFNRKNKSKPGYDAGHTPSGSLRWVKTKANRGKKNEGGRKKGVSHKGFKVVKSK